MISDVATHSKIQAPMPANPGQNLYPPHIWQAAAEALQLSPRELQITRAVFDDRSEAAMARNLSISSHTVHTHLKRIYQKLGARSRVDAVCIVVAAAQKLE